MTRSRSAQTRRARLRRQQKRRRKITAVGVVAVVVVLVGLLIRAIQPRAITEIILPDSLKGPASADGLAWGPLDAKVLIEEYSDFQ
jgi:hypothetical protein